MAKRHEIKDNDLELIVGRMEELVLANSGLDEFEEIFKLIVAKLFDETQNKPSPEFVARDEFAATASCINTLINKAAAQWPGILPETRESGLSGEHLHVCVRVLQRVRLLSTDLAAFDAAFEHLVSKSTKGNKGQFFTPRHVVECCIRIVNPHPHELVADPACGSGGFLVHALQHMNKKQSKRQLDHNLWGFDFDPRAVRIAKALLLVAGQPNPNVYNLNSLLTPRINTSLSLFGQEAFGNGPRLTVEDVMRTRLGNGFKGFDVIVTNPPFAGEIQETTILSNYDLCRKGRKIERDVLFIERCLNLLAPNGRLAIVLPHNKLGGSNWSYAREWLARRAQIVAVLGLGRHCFLPHTHQKAGVLFLRKRMPGERQEPTEQVLFLINESDGKDSKGKLVFRHDRNLSDGIWESVDHDFADLVETFEEHKHKSFVKWEAA